MFNKIRTFVEAARTAKEMMKDDSAKMATGTFGKIVGLFVIAILIGSIFVVGLQSMANANTTGLTTAQLALYAILGLILVVGALWLILEYVGLV